MKLAIYHFGGIFWDPLPHTLCAACLGIAFMIYLRTRRFEWLFLAYVGVCPFLLAIPASAIEFPLLRYRSQLYFAEVLMLPLAIALGLGHLRSRLIGTKKLLQPSAGICRGLGIRPALGVPDIEKCVSAPHGHGPAEPDAQQ